VIKDINTRLLNNSYNNHDNVDGHLTGKIEYQGKTDTHEVFYGDRDTEDDIILQKGDVVEFNVSTDRRDYLQRAVNIKLISVALKDGQKRDVGVVTSLKDGFGFIKCADQELSIFFHFSEVLEQSHIIDIGQEVEFTIENDTISRRQHATRIRFLPKGSVKFETVSSEKYVGVIDQEASMMRNMKSPSKQKEQEYGLIRCYRDGKEVDVFYSLRDCRPREVPRFCDKVEFILVTKKANHQLIAREISIIEKYEAQYQHGYVCALKESYGFIEADTHDREIFFHYSELDGDPNDLELGDEVQFSETKKSDKRSAENVTRVLSSTIQDENIQSKILEGVVLRPMRTVDPEQEEYEGLLQLVSCTQPDDGDEKVANNDDTTLYKYGITDVLQKKEALQKGDKVNFQLRLDRVTNRERATNISCKRSVLRGKVESIKGQFGFISYDSEDGKSVFFHMTEVQGNSRELRPGDDVQFVVVQNHKSAKRSANRVQKVVDERPEHLTRRRSTRLLSESSMLNRVQVIRQPSGPDGSKGFKIKRDTDTLTELHEEEDNNPDMEGVE
jgi:cold shock CspA family protein